MSEIRLVLYKTIVPDNLYWYTDDGAAEGGAVKHVVAVCEM
jgi:hypothetical protein